jgi:hypothetical protein
MENENRENQSGGIKRNPSRNNTNVNQGQNYEKSFYPETDVDSSGIPDATGTPAVKQSFGEKSSEDQKASSGAGSKQFSEGLSGTTSKGSPVREQQEKQQQSGEGMSGNPKQAGAGASYGQQNKEAGVSPTSGTSGVDYGGGQSRPNPQQAGTDTGTVGEGSQGIGQGGQGLGATSGTTGVDRGQGNPERSGTDQSQLGTGGQGQRLMGEDMDKNRNSGTAPGESNMGNLQNAKRSGQQEGQFNQGQDRGA